MFLLPWCKTPILDCNCIVAWTELKNHKDPTVMNLSVYPTYTRHESEWQAQLSKKKGCTVKFNTSLHQTLCLRTRCHHLNREYSHAENSGPLDSPRMDSQPLFQTSVDFQFWLQTTNPIHGDCMAPALPFQRGKHNKPSKTELVWERNLRRTTLDSWFLVFQADL